MFGSTSSATTFSGFGSTASTAPSSGFGSFGAPASFGVSATNTATAAPFGSGGGFGTVPAFGSAPAFGSPSTAAGSFASGTTTTFGGFSAAATTPATTGFTFTAPSAPAPTPTFSSLGATPPTTSSTSSPFGGGFSSSTTTPTTTITPTPFGGGFGAASSSSTLPPHLSNLTNYNNDYVITDSPIDTISSLHFSSSSSSSAPTLLASSSWSRDISVWEIQTGSNFSSTTSVSSVTSILRARHEFPSPMLCCAWNGENTVLYGGGADNSVVYWDLASDKSGIVGNHTSSVKEVFAIPSLGLVCSASWDRTIRYWDIRTGGNNAVITVELPERAYCADVKNALLVVGCAERRTVIYNLRKPSEPFRKIDPPLRFQLRSVSCFPDETGFALGSIEGRVAITYIQEKDSHKNFAFKCHREASDVYAVNGMSFHPTQGTFITVGSDGTYVSWDKESKQRLKLFQKVNNSLTCGNFSSDGNLFAYGVGYDWSRGVEFAAKLKTPNGILIHRVEESEVKRRK